MPLPLPILVTCKLPLPLPLLLLLLLHLFHCPELTTTKPGRLHCRGTLKQTQQRLPAFSRTCLARAIDRTRRRKEGVGLSIWPHSLRLLQTCDFLSVKSTCRRDSSKGHMLTWRLLWNPLNYYTLLFHFHPLEKKCGSRFIWSVNCNIRKTFWIQIAPANSLLDMV